MIQAEKVSRVGSNSFLYSDKENSEKFLNNKRRFYRLCKFL